MKVAALIAELQKLPGDCPVIIEGTEWNFEVTAVDARTVRAMGGSSKQQAAVLFSIGDEDFEIEDQ